ncbi:T9SS type A sorting domain-containing protein [Flavisericum labens]
MWHKGIKSTEGSIIELGDLSSGVYMVKIIGQNGLAFKKLIKK